jgi:Flp pilus assembly protein TadG
MRKLKREVRIMRKKLASQKGAALVEFAIVLPILLVLVFGIIEFGFLLYNKAVITNASREGAREGILFADRTSGILTTNIEQKVIDYSNNWMIPKTVNPTTTISGACQTEIDYNKRAGQQLIVTVSYPYPFIVFPNIIKLIGGNLDSLLNTDGDLIISAQTSMRCE